MTAEHASQQRLQVFVEDQESVTETGLSRVTEEGYWQPDYEPKETERPRALPDRALGGRRSAGGRRRRRR